MIQADCLVLGTGVAGLTVALDIAHAGRTVVAVAKRERSETATAWAQGGIAAVMGAHDSIDEHVKDTLEAGAGLCHREVVQTVVERAPQSLNGLIDLGARFSERQPNPGSDRDLDLTREGGHSARRVAHYEDMTGREVQRALVAAVYEHPHIQMLEHHMAIDLIDLSKYGGMKRITGAHLLDERSGEVITAVSRHTVLATGGAGKVYLYTSNPDISTGDGVAMAYRAGARIANMEFFQFHPTCLFHPDARTFLISEALRGEGAKLVRADGTAFMHQHHPKADLAPRDITARAIDFEMKRSGEPCVFLDIRHRGRDYILQRFPNIHQTCMRYGIDMAEQPIPVVPAAHYLCGGVKVDHRGHATLPGLWAVGEVACTGLHGANRLASNSLTEGLVYGHIVAEHILTETRQWDAPTVPPWDAGRAVASDEAVVVSHNWEELRRFMWNYVGIVRTDKRLRRAAARVALLQDEIHEYYWNHLVSRDLLELRNIADVAALIISSAAHRKESRGLHHNLDHPDRHEEHRGDTITLRGQAPITERRAGADAPG